MSPISSAIFVIWLVGLPSIAFVNAWLIRQMRRNVASGLAQFKGYTDWRLEGRRASFLRDPSVYNEYGKKCRRWAIVIECLALPWFFGGLLMLTAFLSDK
jgi:uncharacterized membrane protein (DUF485 family)